MTRLMVFPLALGILLPWMSLQITLQNVPGVTGRSHVFVQPSAPFHLLLLLIVLGAPKRKEETIHPLLNI